MSLVVIADSCILSLLLLENAELNVNAYTSVCTLHTACISMYEKPNEADSATKYAVVKEWVALNMIKFEAVVLFFYEELWHFQSVCNWQLITVATGRRCVYSFFFVFGCIISMKLLQFQHGATRQITIEFIPFAAHWCSMCEWQQLKLFRR